MESEALLQQHFDEKIDQDIRIEPKDWMPEKYRASALSLKIGCPRSIGKH